MISRCKNKHFLPISHYKPQKKCIFHSGNQKKADHAFRTAGYFITIHYSLFTLPFYSPTGAKRGMNKSAISLLALSYEDFAGGIVSQETS